MLAKSLVAVEEEKEEIVGVELPALPQEILHPSVLGEERVIGSEINHLYNKSRL